MTTRKYLMAGLIMVYAAAVSLCAYTARLPHETPLVVLFLSLISYFLYWKDKRAAERGVWRTSENMLHILSLMGGWPGAWIARERLRHKSSKTAFKIVFYMTVLLNIIVIVFFILKREGRLPLVLEKRVEQLRSNLLTPP